VTGQQLSQPPAVPVGRLDELWFQLLISYDGTAYRGWQLQARGPSIQGELERAVERVIGQRRRVSGSGRTDAGVHAVAQSASIALPAWPAYGSGLAAAINGWLPDDIAVWQARRVQPGFDARRHATSKRYAYQLYQHLFPDPLSNRQAWWLRRPLDVPAMQRASQQLLGEHDFAPLQSAGSPRATTRRRMLAVELSSWRDARESLHVRIELEANGFLYHMARRIVGMLVAIGQGQLPADAIERVLSGKDAAGRWQNAPPQGLSLLGVRYPDELFL
jgi:tRNA pseudouridine38-40 synthase